MKKAPLARQERELIRAEKLIELYEPFILAQRARVRMREREAALRGAVA